MRHHGHKDKDVRPIGLAKINICQESKPKLEHFLRGCLYELFVHLQLLLVLGEQGLFLKPEDVLSHDKASRSWEIHILLQTMLEPLNIYPT